MHKMSLADARWIAPVQVEAPKRPHLQLVTDDYVPVPRRTDALHASVEAVVTALEALYDVADSPEVEPDLKYLFTNVCSFRYQARKLRMERQA